MNSPLEKLKQEAGATTVTPPPPPNPVIQQAVALANNPNPQVPLNPTRIGFDAVAPAGAPIPAGARPAVQQAAPETLKDIQKPPTQSPAMRNLPPPAPVAEAVEGNYVGAGPTDPDTNKRPTSAPVTFESVRGMFGPSKDYADVRALYPAGTFDSAGNPTPQSIPDPFAYRGATPAVPAGAPAPTENGYDLPALLAAQGLGVGATTPEATTPEAAAPTTGDPRSFKMVNGQKMFTNLTDNKAAVAGLKAAVPVAGMQPPAGGAALGTATDNMRQLENIRALQTPEPLPGAGFNSLTDQNALDNAEKTARWRVDELLSRAGNGMPGAAQAAAALVSGNSQQAVAALQAEAQRRAQDTALQTAAENRKVQMRGQDIEASRADKQYGLGMRKVDADATNSAADRETRLKVAEMNVGAEDRKTAVLQRAAAAKADDVEWKQDMKTGLYYDAKAKNPRMFSLEDIAAMQQAKK